MIPALVGPVAVHGLRGWLDHTGDLPSGPPRGTTPVTQLARGMLAHGSPLLVVTLDDEVDATCTYEGDLLRLVIVPTRQAGRTRDLFRAERRGIAAALRTGAPAVAHAHWTYEYGLGALSSGVPTIITVRDWAPTIFRLQPSPYRAVRLAMSTAAMLRCRHFTVTSPYMRARVQRWSRTPVALVPNAIDDEAFTGTRHAPESPLLLAVNNGFGARKNVTTLLEAFAGLRRRWPGAELTLVGYDYHEGGPAERWAQARQMADGVHFLGERTNEEVHDLMDRASVFVHPALEESFGLVLVEAMAHGVPVVAGERSGAVPWVLDAGRAGVLVDVTSPASLAAAVERLLADPDHARAVAEAGHGHAREHFRVSRVVERYLNLYETVAHGQNGGHGRHGRHGR